MEIQKIDLDDFIILISLVNLIILNYNEDHLTFPTKLSQAEIFLLIVNQSQNKKKNNLFGHIS